MKGGDIIYRTILVTECIHTVSGLRTTIYGRYDAVTLQRKSLKVLRSYPKKYSMTDAEFAKYGHEMEEK